MLGFYRGKDQLNIHAKLHKGTSRQVQMIKAVESIVAVYVLESQRLEDPGSQLKRMEAEKQQQHGYSTSLRSET